ncbi:hypothetical protein MHYP_G00114290 [Metynnis hypsauchen]
MIMRLQQLQSRLEGVSSLDEEVCWLSYEGLRVKPPMSSSQGSCKRTCLRRPGPAARAQSLGQRPRAAREEEKRNS